MNTDKAVQALPTLTAALDNASGCIVLHNENGDIVFYAADGKMSVERREQECVECKANNLRLAQQVAESFNAALTHRQQGVVGQAELRNVIESYANAKADLALHPTHESAKVYFKIISGQLTDVLAALTPAPPAQPQSEPSELLREAHGQIKHLLEDLTTAEDEGGLVRYAPKANLLFSNLIGALHTLAPKMEAALAAQPPERAAQQEAQEAQEAVKRPEFECASQYATKRGLAVTREWVRGWDACTDYVEEVLAASPPRAVEPMPALTDEQLALAGDAYSRDIALGAGTKSAVWGMRNRLGIKGGE